MTVIEGVTIEEAVGVKVTIGGGVVAVEEMT